MSEVGDRIRGLMPTGMSQRQLAELAGMTPDALSRALSGQRGLSSFEAAQIAAQLGANTHWMITGSPDPLEVQIAARHAWDPQRRQRTNVGQEHDQTVLDRVIELYRAASPQGRAPANELSDDPDTMRHMLGEAFVRDFANILERNLGVDVVRIPGLTTDYSLRIGERGVVVLATMPSWFRSNWSLAHELGHLALGHHNSFDSPRMTDRHERDANAFASRLLIPENDLNRLIHPATEAEVARWVWDLGISTEALHNRLGRSSVVQSPVLSAALAKRTQQLIRDNIEVIDGDDPFADPIAMREQAASARRFPAALLSLLQRQTELGATSPTHLAWALDVPVDDLDFPEPDEETAAAIYERISADRPTTDDWRTLIAANAKP